jgi:CrcB protein
MNGFLLVALGGGLGAAARYGVNLAVMRWGATGWPWATLGANVTGGLLMGVLAGWLAGRGPADGLRLFLATGVLGGFTTFSAFSLEVVRMIEAGQWSRAGAYAGVSVAASVGALMAGLWLARRLWA